MTTINEGVGEIKNLTKEIGIESATIEKEILGMHESATKLWETIINDKNNIDKINKRIAGSLIAVFAIADKLSVQDLELCLKNRIKEIKESQT